MLPEKAEERSVVTRLADKADAFALDILAAAVSEQADSEAVTNISDLVQSLASDLAATRTEVSAMHAPRAEYTCPGGNLTACLPLCNAELHGYTLLTTIDGTDTKFSCNLAHGLYSWMGAASEGGYLGADAQSFFSAVVSGAAGSYIVTLTADAGIGTDLVIELGQNVRISGDPGLAVPPSLGGGGFTVQEGGSLSLTGVVLTGSVSVLRDGILHLNEVVFAGRSYNFDVAEGAVLRAIESRALQRAADAGQNTSASHAAVAAAPTSRRSSVARRGLR